ncbi:MAG: hypothetical protein NUV46_04825 [Nanoarchaeota archaeon]|nr:hypothetical protein [Nanoarchaeota archaeon]
MKWMGLFSKKEQKQEFSLPELPELPDMPRGDFSEIDDEMENELHELPSFPTSNMGDKFSRESIKNAISGYDEEEPQITRQELIPRAQFNAPSRFLKNDKLPEMPKKIPLSNQRSSELMKREVELKEAGPVFIRIDKFEEALKIFKGTKEKINDIEKLLEETKELKEKEEGELSTWESEIQGMKQQIEKVDRDIFSKI